MSHFIVDFISHLTVSHENEQNVKLNTFVHEGFPAATLFTLGLDNSSVRGCSLLCRLYIGMLAPAARCWQDPFSPNRQRRGVESPPAEKHLHRGCGLHCISIMILLNRMSKARAKQLKKQNQNKTRIQKIQGKANDHLNNGMASTLWLMRLASQNPLIKSASHLKECWTENSLQWLLMDEIEKL